MGINSYNDDELKFSKLLKDLKELPQIKTEENFEYNLMARIQNKNFGNLIEDDKPQIGIIKFVLPSIIIIVIILFIIFLPKTEENLENPLMADPPKISENNLVESSNLSSNSEIIKPRTSKKVKQDRILSENIEVKEQVHNPKVKYPINKARSVSLDEYISGEIQNNNMTRGNIVKGGEEIYYDFNEFLIQQPLDQKSIQKYRKMIDSLKKIEIKRDSIKR